jgi:peptidoglycan/LPS O-acetylase OafA/YrhL
LLFGWPATASARTWSLIDGLNVLMLHSWVPIEQVYFSANISSWSISDEWSFYILFIFLLPSWRRLQTAALAGGLLLIVALSAGSALAGVPGFGNPTPWRVDRMGLLCIFPLARLFEFMLGMATAELWRRAAPRRTGALRGTVVEAAAFGLATAAMYASGALAKAARNLPVVGDGVQAWLLISGATCLPFALLIAVLASQRGWLSRLLACKLLVLLGEISFSIYLLHMTILSWFVQHVTAFDDLPGWALYALAWLILLLGSHLLWAGVEKSLRAWIVGLWPAPGAVRRPSRARSFWGRPSAPGWGGLTLEALALTGLLGGTAWWAARPTIYRLSPSRALATAQQGWPAARDVRFGDRLTLRAAQIKRTPAGLRVQLTWQNLEKPPSDLVVRLAFFGPGEKLTCQVDHPLNQEPAAATAVLWAESEAAPAWLVAEARTLALVVFSPTTGALPIDRGPSNATGCALLVPTP